MLCWKELLYMYTVCYDLLDDRVIHCKQQRSLILLQDYTDTDDHMDQFTTYPSPKPTFCPKWEVGDNVGLGEG